MEHYNFHYVYEITNNINQKKYIGKHSTNNLDDGYMGSGVFIRKAIDKYGLENFTKTIIKKFDTSEEAFKFEAELVTEDVVKDRMYYNMKLGGYGGIYITDEIRKKMSESAKIRCKEGRHSLQGKRRTEHSIKLMNETNKAKWESDPSSHNRVGKTHSAETIEKMKRDRKGKKLHENSKRALSESIVGSTFYNNGIINKRIRRGQVPPDGFVKGRLTKWQ